MYDKEKRLIRNRIAAFFPPAKAKLDITASLANTSLEHTAWYPGYFTDYFVAPHVKSNMAIVNIVFDMANNIAAIPGSGDVPVVLTHTSDIARFVTASLALPKWQPDTYLIGDKVTWNEMLTIAEDVKGVKFQVTHDSIETLKSGKVTELPSHKAMYSFMPKEQLQGFLSAIEVMFASGVFDFKPGHTIDQNFPYIKPRTVKELIIEAWKGK